MSSERQSYEQHDDMLLRLFIFVVAVLAVPVALPVALFAAVWYFLPVGQAARLAAAGIGALVLYLYQPLLRAYFETFHAIYNILLSKLDFNLVLYLSNFLAIAAVSLPVGAGVAAVITELVRGRAAKISSREAPPRVPGWRLKRLKNPADGVTLGLDSRGRRVALTDQQAQQHVLVCGATGSGKTKLLQLIVQGAAQRGRGVLFVDGKGGSGLEAELQAALVCDKLKVFKISGEVTWDPLRRGTSTERKDKLISVEAWESQFYQRAAERYLQMLFNICDTTGFRPSLEDVVKLMNPGVLGQFVQRLKDDVLRNSVESYLERLSVDRGLAAGVAGFESRLAVLVESDAGHLLGGGEGAIDLVDDLTAGKVVLFSLPASDIILRKTLGALVIQDLRASLPELARANQTYYAVFDEFSAYATPALADIVARARSAGVAAVIATQELADFDMIDKAMTSQILGNTATKIILRQDNPASAETFARTIGTRAGVERTLQFERAGWGGMAPSGRGSERIVDEFLVHPQIFKSLAVGQAVYVTKVPRFYHGIVSLRLPGGR